MKTAVLVDGAFYLKRHKACFKKPWELGISELFTVDQMASVARSMVEKRLKYRELIA